MKKFKLVLKWIKWKFDKFIDWKAFRVWYANNQNEEFFRKQNREFELRRKESKRPEWASCMHVAGSSPLSEGFDPYCRTSIVWHTLTTGEEIGICTVCQRTFFPSDEDYDVWKKGRSFNKPSSSGLRKFRDNKKAEPNLIRDINPTPQMSPYSPVKGFSGEPLEHPIIPPVSPPVPDDSPDPWLLNRDGTKDELMIVDFSTPFESEDKDVNHT